MAMLMLLLPVWAALAALACGAAVQQQQQGPLSCPAACNCTMSTFHAGSDVDCRARDLATVPGDLPPDAWLLKMGYNKVQKLSAEMFEKIPGVESINLENNGISSFHLKTFSGTKKLQMLNLYGNSLSQIPPKAFQNLYRLKFLLLGKNQITSLSSDTFHGLKDLSDLDMPLNNLAELQGFLFKHVPSLKILDLGFNKIHTISPQAFVGLHTLDFLNLDGNRLKEVPDGLFQPLQQLEMLVLSNNDIASVAAATFVGLQGLRQLYLSGNRLASVPRDAFKHIPKLTHLTLDNNNHLHSLDGGAISRLRDLSMLYLHGNPWACDCKLAPLVKWLSRAKVELFPEDSGSCSSPAALNGTRLDSIASTKLC
uniref:Protein slit-like n=1 Tax=Petromyzon marinus TaxID=7757 RepID=A0AAJ7TKJ6_PETMA|nr:protein slit-like [Petromyzon marinus]